VHVLVHLRLFIRPSKAAPPWTKQMWLSMLDEPQWNIGHSGAKHQKLPAPLEALASDVLTKLRQKSSQAIQRHMMAPRSAPKKQKKNPPKPSIVT
jgi:hypothetical protein